LIANSYPAAVQSQLPVVDRERIARLNP